MLEAGGRADGRLSFHPLAVPLLKALNVRQRGRIYARLFLSVESVHYISMKKPGRHVNSGLGAYSLASARIRRKSSQLCDCCLGRA